ncbi:MAG TPA: hypothetical protein VKA83_09175 [Methylomirabilota bacterium]|nr:hypothetical protein [Methylomirabilota bacterium]
MNRIQVKVGGKLIGERKTPRSYTHAVVAERFARVDCERVPVPAVNGVPQSDRMNRTVVPVEPQLEVISYHHGLPLAMKGLAAFEAQYWHRETYRNATVFVAEIVPVQPRKPVTLTEPCPSCGTRQGNHPRGCENREGD